MAVFFPDLVGEGAFSQVFRGKYQGAEVAIKRLNTPLSSQDKNYFAAEVRCSSQGDIQCCGQMQVTVIVSSAVQWSDCHCIKCRSIVTLISSLFISNISSLVYQWENSSLSRLLTSFE